MSKSEQRIPPDETHPRHQEWFAASIRYLMATRKLDGMSATPESSADYSTAHTEWLTAKAEYDAIVTKIANSASPAKV